MLPNLPKKKKQKQKQKQIHEGRNRPNSKNWPTTHKNSSWELTYLDILTEPSLEDLGTANE